MWLLSEQPLSIPLFLLAPSGDEEPVLPPLFLHHTPLAHRPISRPLKVQAKVPFSTLGVPCNALELMGREVSSCHSSELHRKAWV